MTTTYPGRPLRVHAINGEREEVIAGLRELADKLENDPQMPVWRYGIEVMYSPRDGREGVERIADHLGIKVEESPAMYRAIMRLGPRVSYVLYAPKVEGQS